ncbi:hypothetical protein EDB87DRAFT_1577225 [Lactarius vividus]|nr:hypothetical protein EDB87DRAFT_1577225 [Lactarius vividus]
MQKNTLRVLNTLLGRRTRKCEHQVDFAPETAPALVLCAGRRRTLFKLARALSRALLKAVWRGLKRAIGPLVARINGMGWRIKVDVQIHLNIANGSGDVVDRSFEPIRYEFPRAVEATPSVEGADQIFDENSPFAG